MIRLNQIHAVLFILLLAVAQSAVGGSASEFKIAATITAGSTEDSLVGTWDMTNLDMPDVRTQIAAASSQTEKDLLLSKIVQYQNQTSGMSITMGRDYSYTAARNGKSKSGTWKVNANREIITHITSRETPKDDVVSIMKVDSHTLIVKYNNGTDVFIVTYTRR